MSSRVSKEEFAQLVRLHAAEVIDVTSHLLTERSEAEDGAQDAFVKAYRQLSSFRGESSLLTWVQRIAYREALNHLSRKRPDMVDIESLSVDDETADELALDNEQRIQFLEEAIDELLPDEQLLLHLFYYKNVKLRDVAYIMDVEPNLLSARLYRIRKKLYRMIKQKENE